MHRFLLIVCLLLAAPAWAQTQLLTGAGTGGSGGASSYVGPGDILSGSTLWYGLRAYNQAYAVANGKAVNIRRASDNTLLDVSVLSNGNFNTAAANTFAGVDATGTGAITGTTLTFTGGHVGDMVTGGTVAAGTYIVSGSSPTWTVNISQTVASATLTLQWALFVAKWYDQSGNGRDAVQATTGNQPLLVPTALPFMAFNGTTSNLTTGAATVAQPFSISYVGQRTGAFTSVGEIFRNGGSGTIFFRYGASTNLVEQYAGTTQNATASDSTAHAIQAVYSAALSVLTVDGTDKATNPSTNTISSTSAIGQFGGTEFLTANTNELGLWPVAFSSGNRTSLHTNQSVFWGTP